VPIVITRDDERRRLTIVLSDPWSVEEISRSMNQELTDNTWKYGKLYDLRGTMAVPTEPDVLWLVRQHDQQTARHGSRGPIAVITAPTSQGLLMQQYATRAGAQNRMQLKVFDDEIAAHEWLSAVLASAK
jgi:hypothetical protein